MRFSTLPSLITYTLIASALSACGGGGSGSGSDSIDFSAANNSLLPNTSWEGLCTHEPENDNYNDAAVNFSQSQLTLTSGTSNFSDCSSPFLQIRATVNYQEAGQKTIPTGQEVTRLRISNPRFYMTILTSEAVARANENTVCGFNQWQLNVERVVSNNSDCFELTSQTDIAFISDNTLFFGDDSTADADGFPTQLLFSEPYSRKSEQ